MKIEQRVLLGRVERLEISETDLGDLEYLLEEDDAGEEAALRSLLELAVVTLAADRRDVTALSLHNTWWMASGGMSWEAAPTDAYDLLGEVSMQLEIASLDQGQFFTPYSPPAARWRW